MCAFRQVSIRSRLKQRARIFDSVRDYFNASGFLEIETPIRIPAPAPEAHIDARESENWYLQTSPELCMKRLLAAGYEKIFQIARCFRKGERGARHLPEMTLLEWYVAGADYLELMTQCEELITFLATREGLGRQLSYQGYVVDLTPPWDRLSVAEAFKQFGGMTAHQAVEKNCFDELMGIAIEPHLGLKRPLFLYDYPAPCAALARLKPTDLSVAERFELYIAGIELCNAFTELSDPTEQRARFEVENRTRIAGGKTVYPTAEPFLRALATMPAAAGNALGLDRLAMLFCDAASIDEVVAFVPEEL